MRYRYQYTTASTFVPQIEWHFFKLRAVPCDNEFQHVTESRLEITPPCEICHSTDGQGNALQWGSIGYGHTAFDVTSAGVVEQTRPYLLHGEPAAYYLTPTRLTTCTPAMQRRCMEGGGPAFAVALALMHFVHDYICYTPCHTTVSTTAAEVWSDPQGVCQDYAHLMIALCRASGIHARYVCGLIEGEGQTHAWIEVSDGKVWRGFDPTHDCAIDWGYVKIAHGRDADDCTVNRGRFYGWTSETMRVTATLVHCEE